MKLSSVFAGLAVTAAGGVAAATGGGVPLQHAVKNTGDAHQPQFMEAILKVLKEVEQQVAAQGLAAPARVHLRGRPVAAKALFHTEEEFEAESDDNSMLTEELTNTDGEVVDVTVTEAEDDGDDNTLVQTDEDDNTLVQTDDEVTVATVEDLTEELTGDEEVAPTNLQGNQTEESAPLVPAASVPTETSTVATNSTLATVPAEQEHSLEIQRLQATIVANQSTTLEAAASAAASNSTQQVLSHQLCAELNITLVHLVDEEKNLVVHLTSADEQQSHPSSDSELPIEHVVAITATPKNCEMKVTEVDKVEELVNNVVKAMGEQQGVTRVLLPTTTATTTTQQTVEAEQHNEVGFSRLGSLISEMLKRRQSHLEASDSTASVAPQETTVAASAAASQEATVAASAAASQEATVAASAAASQDAASQQTTAAASAAASQQTTAAASAAASENSGITFLQKSKIVAKCQLLSLKREETGIRAAVDLRCAALADDLDVKGVAQLLDDTAA